MSLESFSGILNITPKLSRSAALCGTMANRSNFRVKVDLSTYHQDARRFSWIFVDSASCWLISHIKQHIVKIFGIQEPFHLLLNGNEYLPPTEDVRILKENEIIVVAPGLGLNDTNAFPSSMHSLAIQNGCTESGALKLAGAVLTRQQNDNQTDSSVADISTAADTMYQSMSEVTEIESVSDSKGTGDNSTENGRTSDICEMPVRKRKRTRRKKAIKEMKIILAETINDKPQSNKYQPKISGSSVIPTGKHIRFDNVDTNKVDEIENSPNNLSTRKPYVSDPVEIKHSGIANLSTLLALRKSSSPLTFTSKRVHSQNDNAFVDKERTIKSSNSPIESQETNDELSIESSDVAKRSGEESNYSQLNFEKYPILKSAPELNDIIAFKILKIGKDYSPEISDYIVAKTRLWCPNTLLYTFEILKGQDQIQTPIGKFTLPENNAEDEEIDIANFNFSQLIDPRLIRRQ